MKNQPTNKYNDEDLIKILIKLKIYHILTLRVYLLTIHDVYNNDKALAIIFLS